MSQSDRLAVAVIVGHHTRLAASLDGLVTELIAGVEIGDARRVERAHAVLLGWLREEVLPQAYAKEATLYRAAARRPGGSLLIDGLIGEHGVIAELIGELADAASPVRAAATARALQAVFGTHLSKENDLVVPLLVASPDVDLAGLLDSMHGLTGEHAETDVTAQAGGCGCGGCGCENEGAAAAAPIEAPLTIDPRLDVREVPHAQRHGLVLTALDALPVDGGLVLVAPHAPLPLLAQIEKRYGGAFTTEWLLEGPQVWQVRLQRTAA